MLQALHKRAVSNTHFVLCISCSNKQHLDVGDDVEMCVQRLVSLYIQTIHGNAEIELHRSFKLQTGIPIVQGETLFS